MPKTNYKRSYWLSNNKKIRATIDIDIKQKSLEEEKDITFFGSNAKGCRKTWNKAKCKEALIHANISTPEYIITENILDEGFPLGRFKNN